jgi:hypothetical protein
MKPFEEIVQFIAEAVGAERLSAFRPSAAAEKRVSKLLARQKFESLTPKEREELQMFVQLDHVMSLAKARARVRGRSRCLSAAASEKTAVIEVVGYVGQRAARASDETFLDAVAQISAAPVTGSWGTIL